MISSLAAWGGAAWTKVPTNSSASSCPSCYIPVPAYALPDGTQVPAFCVMKYEAKQSTTAYGDRNIGGSGGALPVSTSAGTPWVNLTWQDARSACAATGSQLITEDQWLSLAHQVTSVASNWSGGAVGSGYVYSGHNDNSPANALAASDDSDGYFGTGNTSGNQRRTLTLPNGQMIWDLAGNVWEWVDATIAAASRYHGGASQVMSYNTSDGFSVASSVPVAKRPQNNWNASQGMGRYYDGYSLAGAFNSYNESPENCADYCTPTAVFLRGGAWVGGAHAGAFSLYLNYGRSAAGIGSGFRCTR